MYGAGGSSGRRPRVSSGRRPRRGGVWGRVSPSQWGWDLWKGDYAPPQKMFAIFHWKWCISLHLTRVFKVQVPIAAAWSDIFEVKALYDDVTRSCHYHVRAMRHIRPLLTLAWLFLSLVVGLITVSVTVYCMVSSSSVYSPVCQYWYVAGEH